MMLGKQVARRIAVFFFRFTRRFRPRAGAKPAKKKKARERNGAVTWRKNADIGEKACPRGASSSMSVRCTADLTALLSTEFCSKMGFGQAVFAGIQLEGPSI